MVAWLLDDAFRRHDPCYRTSIRRPHSPRCELLARYYRESDLVHLPAWREVGLEVRLHGYGADHWRVLLNRFAHE